MSVPAGQGFKIIPYADILWMHPDKHYTRLVLCNGKSSLYIYESLDELKSILPPVFYKCHRSAIVNLCHVESFDEEGIHIRKISG